MKAEGGGQGRRAQRGEERGRAQTPVNNGLSRRWDCAPRVRRVSTQTDTPRTPKLRLTRAPPDPAEPASRRSQTREGVAQTPNGLAGAVLRVESKMPQVLPWSRHRLLSVVAPSASHGSHSARSPAFRERLCATASRRSDTPGGPSVGVRALVPRSQRAPRPRADRAFATRRSRARTNWIRTRPP